MDKGIAGGTCYNLCTTNTVWKFTSLLQVYCTKILSLLLKNRSENMPPKTAPPTANEEIRVILENTSR